MAGNKPQYLIQYERKKSGESGLTRYLISRSNWITVGSENKKDVAVEKAKSMPGRIRVIESYR